LANDRQPGRIAYPEALWFVLSSFRRR